MGKRNMLVYININTENSLNRALSKVTLRYTPSAGFTAQLKKYYWDRGQSTYLKVFENGSYTWASMEYCNSIRYKEERAKDLDFKVIDMSRKKSKRKTFKQWAKEVC